MTWSDIEWDHHAKYGFAIRQGRLETPGLLKLMYVDGGYLNLGKAECLRSFYREFSKYAKVNFIELLDTETISLLSHKYNSTSEYKTSSPWVDSGAWGEIFNSSLKLFFGVCYKKIPNSFTTHKKITDFYPTFKNLLSRIDIVFYSNFKNTIRSIVRLPLKCDDNCK